MKIRSVGRTANEPELLIVTFEFDHPADSSRLMDHLYKAMKERVGVWIEYDNDPAGSAEAAWQGDLIIEGETAAAPSPTSSLPTIAELTGSDPDFTGAQTTAEYLREMRGGSG